MIENNDVTNKETKEQINSFLHNLLIKASSLLIWPPGVPNDPAIDNGSIRFGSKINLHLDDGLLYHYWYAIESYKKSEDVYIKLDIESSEINRLIAEISSKRSINVRGGSNIYGFMQVDIYAPRSKSIAFTEANEITRNVIKICNNNMGFDNVFRIVNIGRSGEVIDNSIRRSMCPDGFQRATFDLHYIINKL